MCVYLVGWLSACEGSTKGYIADVWDMLNNMIKIRSVTKGKAFNPFPLCNCSDENSPPQGAISPGSEARDSFCQCVRESTKNLPHMLCP